MWASTVSGEDPPASMDPTASAEISPAKGTHGSTDISASFDVIPITGNFAESQREPALPCRLLEPHTRNHGFLGRANILSQLNSALLEEPSGHSALRAYALCGLGGIGKTQIALEYAFSHENDFDANFMVQADDREKLAEGFGQIASERNLVDSADKGNLVISCNIVMEWLSNPYKQTTEQDERLQDSAGAKWLLIFDNADNPEVLRDYWPSLGRGSVLITTRDPKATKTNFYTIPGIDLNTLDVADTSDLLFTLTQYPKTQHNKDQSLALARRLDGLPLAILQISAYLRRRDMTFQEGLTLYEKETSMAGLHQANDHSGHTLSTVWALDLLSLQSLNLLNLLSIMVTDAVQEFILTQDLPNTVPFGFYTSNIDYIDARTDLLKSSLVKRNMELGQLTLHRLVQDVARAHMTEDRLSWIANVWSFPRFAAPHTMGNM